MKTSAEKSVVIELNHDWIPGVSLLFQKGVTVDAQTGCSVQAFLCDQLGLSREYVEARIQTIMLNGKIVDDPKTAAIQSGGVLSLSAAIPGLLGATLRTGSYYAAMRSQISWKGGAPTSGGGQGTFVIKLFNILINEVGTRLLRRGVWVQAADLASLMIEQREWLHANGAKIFVDDSDADLERLSQTAWGSGSVFFRIRRSRG